MKNFTFKKHKRVGKFRSFELKNTDIKLSKCGVGLIGDSHEKGWRISFAIKREKTKENPAPFRWVTLKYKPEDEKDARAFLKKHSHQIQEKYNLYLFEKEGK